MASLPGSLQSAMSPAPTSRAGGYDTPGTADGGDVGTGVGADEPPPQREQSSAAASSTDTRFMGDPDRE